MPAPAAPPTTAPKSGLKPVATPSTAPDAAPIPPPVTARWPQVSPQAVAVKRMAVRTMYLRMSHHLLADRVSSQRPYKILRVQLRRKGDGPIFLAGGQKPALPEAERRRHAQFHDQRDEHRR